MSTNAQARQSPTQQSIRWCVPQSLLDVANSVEWSHIPVPPASVAQGLRMLATRRKGMLPSIQTPPPLPASPPVLHVAPDVPQAVLDVFNEIDWTRVAERDLYEMVTELESFVFGPFVNLPRRHWP